MAYSQCFQNLLFNLGYKIGSFYSFLYVHRNESSHLYQFSSFLNANWNISIKRLFHCFMNTYSWAYKFNLIIGSSVRKLHLMFDWDFSLLTRALFHVLILKQQRPVHSFMWSLPETSRELSFLSSVFFLIPNSINVIWTFFQFLLLNSLQEFIWKYGTLN